jgi:hypothetical protein
MSTKDVRSRAWLFTINNYTEQDELECFALTSIATCLVVGKERGKENNTPHYQGYVYFKEAKSFKKMKKLLPRANLLVPKGTHQQCVDYCKKQEVGYSDGMLIEHGSVPKMGERTDIDEVRDMLKQGANMRTIVNDAKSYQSMKMAEMWLKYHEQPRKWKPEVKWFYGPTGSGKTKSAYEWLGEQDTYTCMNSMKWLEGYDGHSNVLIDDFRSDFAKFQDMLRVLDRYELRVENKGGSRQFLAKKIAITSPYHPKGIYQTLEDVTQFLRRIDEIIYIGPEEEKSKYDFTSVDDLMIKCSLCDGIN